MEEPAPASSDASTTSMTLTRMSALIVLDRIPVPVIAIDADAVIGFANPAFSDLLGRAGRDLISIPLRALLRDRRGLPGSSAELAGLAGSVLTMLHVEGWEVRARLSNGVPLNDADCLFAFEDVTRLIWEGVL